MTERSLKAILLDAEVCIKHHIDLYLFLPNQGATDAKYRKLWGRRGPKGIILGRNSRETRVQFNPHNVKKWIEKELKKNDASI